MNQNNFFLSQINSVVNGKKIQFGMKLDRRDRTQSGIIGAMYLHKTMFEHETSLTICKILENGDGFIDVGANVGWFSLLARSLVGAEGKVFAIEPNPDNLQTLKTNISYNKEFENIVIIQKAVGDYSGKVKFYAYIKPEDETFIEYDSNGMLWSDGHIEGKNNKCIDVDCEKIDDVIIDKEESIKCLKIDVEGAEIKVISGGKSLIHAKNIPFVICEVNGPGLKQHQTSQASLRSLMLERGYECFLMQGDETMPLLVPPGTDIHFSSIGNVLFSTQERISEIWPVIRYAPHADTVEARVRQNS